MNTPCSTGPVYPPDDWHDQQLPILGSTLDEFVGWSVQRGEPMAKASRRRRILQRLEPWFSRRKQRVLADVTTDDIEETCRFYSPRSSVLVRALRVLGQFLIATHRLKPGCALRQLKRRAYDHYRHLPLFGPLVDDFAQWSLGRGFSCATACYHLNALRRLVPWFQRRGKRSVGDFTIRDIAQVRHYYRSRKPAVAGGIREFGDFLRARGQLRPDCPRPPTRLEREVTRFGDYLRKERGLAEGTIRSHSDYLHQFLSFLHFDRKRVPLAEFTLMAVHRFLGWKSRHCCRHTMSHVVATLRAFLRFQFRHGTLSEPLHTQIDTVRIYRDEYLAHPLPWTQIQQLLRTLDRSTPVGMRDFAILLMAATYGLRRSELVALTLEDIDWRAHTLRLAQPKTRQTLRLPLTNEVGQALAHYLRNARPSSAFRQVFLRRRPPAGPLGPTGVACALARAARITGVQLDTTRFHALRHSFALRLLREGVALKSIGDVLGHRDLNTTSSYLRLNVEDLRQVALPTPDPGAPAGQLGPIVQDDDGHWHWKPKRHVARTVTAPGGFHSFLAASLRDYLATQRALGRAYLHEEWILRTLDFTLHRHYPGGRVLTKAMFQRWAVNQAVGSGRTYRMLCVAKFCRYLARTRSTTFVPNAQTLPKPLSYPTPYLVSEHEMVRLLAGTRTIKPSRKNLLRPQTMRLALLLLYCCGLRRGELLRLRLADLDMDQQFLRIEQTKFYKSRLVPFSPSVGQELREYLEQRRTQGMPSDVSMPLVWNGRSGRTGGALSPTAITANWFRICRCAEVFDHRGRPPRIHDLRHSFAVTALQRGYQAGQHPQATLPRLARYLGHACSAFTHHYLQFTEPLRQVASERFRRQVAATVLSSDQPKPPDGGAA